MSKIQSVVFLKNKGWTPTKARLWLKEKGIVPLKAVHSTKTQHRYRILKPNFRNYTTKKNTNGINIIYGYN